MNKKILVTRSSMPGMDEYVQEIRSLWDTHWITNMGQKHIELQNALKKYLNVDNVELLVNGHMALEMTLQACHTYNVESLSIRKFVNAKKGIPYINVETDYSQADIGQLNTRIAAFIEML